LPECAGTAAGADKVTGADSRVVTVVTAQLPTTGDLDRLQAGVETGLARVREDVAIAGKQWHVEVVVDSAWPPTL